MGGRFDATNVIDVPDLAVITTISRDHTQKLGNTLARSLKKPASSPGGDAGI